MFWHKDACLGAKNTHTHLHTDTHTYTHTEVHANVLDKSNFKKPGHWPHTPGLKIYSIYVQRI